MEIMEENCIADQSFYHSSPDNSFSNIIADDHLQSIFEIVDARFDETMNRSSENCSVTSGCSSKILDNMSDQTSSSLENELEVMMNDYRKIISCLKTECKQRSDSEIATLSQLLQSISEFMNLNSSQLELLCQSARLVTVENANTLIVKRYSMLEFWYFCLYGSLRKEDDHNTIISAGSYIGTNLDSDDPLISDYNLYSNSDRCELMVIRRDDLILSNRLNNLIIKTSDENRTVIAVYEVPSGNINFQNETKYVLSKGTSEILVNSLLTGSKWIHRDFIEDFFMTYKLYSISVSMLMDEITKGISESFEEASEKIEILTHWLTQNFSDFEKDVNKMKFLENIAKCLKDQNYQDLLYKLYDCWSTQSPVRRDKTKLSFKYIVPVDREHERTSFYVSNINDGEFLKNGDLLLCIEEYSQDYITKELLQVFCDDNRQLSVVVRNDILGYHEFILKDISVDTCSLRSNQSSRIYNRCLSDKVSDSFSVSTNDSDLSSTSIIDVSPSVKKRPSIIPNILSTLQNGTVGRFFKNPKNFSKTLTPSNKTVIDFSNELNMNFQRPKIMSGSTISIQRISRRSKHQRKSAGSNPEIIKSFEEMDVTDNETLPINSCSQSNEFPIKIYWKETFIGRAEPSTAKSDLRIIYLMIKPTMPVSEIIILALLQLNLSSAASNNFYLVEVVVDPNVMMIHEKILRPSTINLRLKIQSRYYLKHNSYIGTCLVSQKESEKMINEFLMLSLLKLSINEVVLQLFLRSHRLLCAMRPIDLISYVTGNKATLKLNKKCFIHLDGIVNQYIQLSDFYKNWVITEICSEQMCSTKRSKLIHYFLALAYKAFHIGHIDLFFSLISGLDSIEITRLFTSWDKVSNHDKKLFNNLKTYLNVSGNMRNLRSVHQNKPCPFIPVTAMVIKDLTMIDETNSTFVEGTINGLQVNKDLVNFDKMRKMCKLSRIFINSICSCTKDKSKPIKKHSYNCTARYENEEKLKSLLVKRMEAGNNHFSSSSFNFDQKIDRKHSISNLSMKSSSSESVTDPISPTKVSPDTKILQSYNQERTSKWVEFYLSKLENMVVTDTNQLSKMSFSCGINIQSTHNTLKSKQSKHCKSQGDLVFNFDHFPKDAPNPAEISDKAAEILGLKNKSTIHKFKKSGHGS